MEASDHAIYIDTSEPGISNVTGPRYERRLESKYLDNSGSKNCYRVETFRSPGNLSGTGLSKSRIRCYFVYQSQFVEPNPSPTETRLEVVGDRMFLQKATKNTMQIYQQIIEEAVSRTGPVIEVFDIEDSKEKRLVVAFRRRTAIGMFSALSDLYHYYGVTSSRKYVEQFSNGISVICLYLKPAANLENASRFPPLEQSIYQITKEISLLYCIPQNKFQAQFISGELSLQETIYGHCVWVFVQHFLNRLGMPPSNYDLILANKFQVRNMLLWFLSWTLITAHMRNSFQRSSDACERRHIQQIISIRSSTHTLSLSDRYMLHSLAPTSPAVQTLMRFLFHQLRQLLSYPLRI